MENTNWLSRLFFSWVNPLMEKGCIGKVKNSDDLYDLPDSLTCGYVSAMMETCFGREEQLSSKYIFPIRSSFSEMFMYFL